MDKLDQLTNLLQDSAKQSPLLAGLSHPKYQPLTMVTMVQPQPSRFWFWAKLIVLLNLLFVVVFFTLPLMSMRFQQSVDSFGTNFRSWNPSKSEQREVPHFRSFRMQAPEVPLLFDHRINLGLIVNGEDVPDTEAKFQVQIRQIEPVSGTDTFCGGTLISSRYVLTASHCFNPQLPVSTLSVRYGTHKSEASDYADVRVVKAIRHPYYDDRYSHNDIAIIKLARTISPGNNVDYAELDFGTLPGEEQVQIYGFGLESGSSPDIATTLKKATLETLTVRECNRALRQANYPNDPKVLCAHSQRQISCSGDSGGGLFTAEGRLAGITSLVEAGCQPGGVAVFTRVSAHYLFIQMHTKLWSL